MKIIRTPCPHCRHQVEVVFDPNYKRDDGGFGDYILDGRKCWNCGLSYNVIFSTDFVVTKAASKRSFYQRAMRGFKP